MRPTQHPLRAVAQRRGHPVDLLGGDAREHRQRQRALGEPLRGREVAAGSELAPGRVEVGRARIVHRRPRHPPRAATRGRGRGRPPRPRTGGRPARLPREAARAAGPRAPRGRAPPPRAAARSTRPGEAASLTTAPPADCRAGSWPRRGRGRSRHPARGRGAAASARPPPCSASSVTTAPRVTERTEVLRRVEAERGDPPQRPVRRPSMSPCACAASSRTGTPSQAARISSIGAGSRRGERARPPRCPDRSRPPAGSDPCSGWRDRCRRAPASRPSPRSPRAWR